MSYDDRESSVQGAAYSYYASVAVDPLDPLIKAAFTMKANLSDADPGALQKIVTTSDVAGTGKIEVDGSTTGIAIIRFDLTGTDTSGLSPRDFWFDVKVKTSSTAPGFGAAGIWTLHQPTTTTVL